MRRVAIALILTLVVLCGARPVAAQYYSWGADRASLRWQDLRAGDLRVVVPDTAVLIGRQTLHYLEAVRPTIGFGFRHGPLKLPVVIHPENFRSNGLVMWMPKRVEFLSTPAESSYSMLWTKQLAAHEYRHAVQYNNLNRGVVRVLSWLLGEQGATVGLLFMPLWALEGDAVMYETESSTFGRGRQPSFSMAYRAWGEEVLRRRNPDHWFCGSYRTHVPDHYQLGYQMLSYAYARYGENIWDKVGRYAVRNPYVFFTTAVGLKKYYKTSTLKLFRATFADLNAHWNALPTVVDSGETLTELPAKNYTTYGHPIPLGDTLIVATKESFERTPRIVVIDRATGAERMLTRTGLLSSRPVVGDGGIWWSESRRSLLFPEQVTSRLCRYDLQTGRVRTLRGIDNALYPTPIDDGALAWVEYTPNGRYAVVERTADSSEHRTLLAVPAELHGLAWDEVTRRLYVLVTDDGGMHLAAVEDGAIRPLTRSAFVTLSDLRAAEGWLYYGSIASGRDELHAFDLTDSTEYRLSSSAYGSFSPAPADDGTVWGTTYDRRGYRIACQTADPVPVVSRCTPDPLLLPERTRWEVTNLDTVRFTAADSLRSAAEHPARRYRKASHLFRVHSWAPVSFDPYAVIEEQSFDFQLGAMLLLQNLLSSTEGFLTYGWNRRQGSQVRGEVRYDGLGPRFTVRATWGGDQMVYGLAQRTETGEIERQNAPPTGRYWSVGGSVVLPLCFDRGARVRQLSPALSWNYSNGWVADVSAAQFDADGRIVDLPNLGFNKGLNKLSVSLTWSDLGYAARRNMATRWGYVLQAGYSLDPLNRDFSDLVSGYAKFYLPGFWVNHSLRLEGAAQHAIGGYRFPGGQSFLGYQSALLLPRGFTTSDITADRYAAAALHYELPLCYPEWGIPAVLYIKRLRLDLGGQYASFRALTERGFVRERIYSYGVDLVVDFNVLRMPDAATSTLRLSLYRPSRGGWAFSVGLGLPL